MTMHTPRCARPQRTPHTHTRINASYAPRPQRGCLACGCCRWGPPAERSIEVITDGHRPTMQRQCQHPRVPRLAAHQGVIA